MLTLLWELVRKDLRIFIADRRSVMISFITPVVLACFIGFLMTSTGKSTAPKKISVLFVDEDKSDFSKNLIERLGKGNSLELTESSEPDATAKVRKGDFPLAIVVPKGFGEAAAKSMLLHSEQPQYRFLVDPSRNVEGQIAKGAMIRATMQSLTKQPIGQEKSDDAMMPFKIADESQARDNSAATSGAAHAFAGMAMQGLLFWAIESAMTLLRERKMGIWRRMRSSPVSPKMFLLGKAISSMVRALAILVVVFGVGFALFKFQIAPGWQSYVGFGAIALSAALMSACFGLFVAALGRNESQSRGLSILAVLGMCMLGGAWFPMFLMPDIMQTISKIVPISWAINGFDGMIWRGQGLTEALLASVVLCGFAALFGVIALKRITWDPEAA